MSCNFIAAAAFCCLETRVHRHSRLAVTVSSSTSDMSTLGANSKTAPRLPALEVHTPPGYSVKHCSERISQIQLGHQTS